jgi:hypothetical protein
MEMLCLVSHCSFIGEMCIQHEQIPFFLDIETRAL